MGYIFTAGWIKGIEHKTADALSRAPVSEPSQEDLRYQDKLRYGASMVRSIASRKLGEDPEHLSDPTIEKLRQVADANNEYQELKKAISNGFPDNTTGKLAKFKKLQEELSVEDGLVIRDERIVIPAAARRETLKNLHRSHQGLVRTQRRARATVYWPGIGPDIKSTIEACFQCQEAQPGHARQPMIIEDPPARPGQDGSADLFTTAGKQFLVYCDRLSGWPEVTQWLTTPTSRQVIRSLQNTFTTLGIPVRIRSDGGPQFKSQEFADFMTGWGIIWSPSSVENPASNGHAESAVKAMKSLLKKTGGDINNEEFKLVSSLLEWRNTPNESGKSPAQIMIGRPLRGLIPTHPAKYKEKIDIEEHREKKFELSQKAKHYHDKKAKPLKPLKNGTRVLIRDRTEKKWAQPAVVVDYKIKDHSYMLETETGRRTSRNRSFLKVDTSKPDKNTDQTAKPKVKPQKKVKFADQEQPTRRSARTQRTPKRYND